MLSKPNILAKRKHDAITLRTHFERSFEPGRALSRHDPMSELCQSSLPICPPDLPKDSEPIWTVPNELQLPGTSSVEHNKTVDAPVMIRYDLPLEKSPVIPLPVDFLEQIQERMKTRRYKNDPDHQCTIWFSNWWLLWVLNQLPLDKDTRRYLCQWIPSTIFQVSFNYAKYTKKVIKDGVKYHLIIIEHDDEPRAEATPGSIHKATFPGEPHSWLYNTFCTRIVYSMYDELYSARRAVRRPNESRCRRVATGYKFSDRDINQEVTIRKSLGLSSKDTITFIQPLILQET